MARLAEITTPKVGDSPLLFHRLTASEKLSEPFHYQVEVLGTSGDIDFNALLGKTVNIKLNLPDDEARHFNGYVTRISLAGKRGKYFLFHMDVRPWLWMLSLTSDCRIFQDKTVVQIIKDVFADHKTAKFEEKLFGSYTPWKYCVQYRETDLNFINRLMENEGLYYYFKHEEGKHTLVLSDVPSSHAPFAGYESLPFVGQLDAKRDDRESVLSWQLAAQLQPSKVMLSDYDFERPSVDLKQAREHADTPVPDKYEVFDYPGEYIKEGDGEHYAVTRLHELQGGFKQATGTTDARGLCCGYTFKLEGFARSEEDAEYVVRGTLINLSESGYEGFTSTSEGSAFDCSFVALPTSQPFRPPRRTPKPSVHGPQTAVVVGPSGDEIFTDKYGRVKVQFHWDREAKSKDLKDKSSCWLRVSQPWAGKNFGFQAIPRIGQEVIVDFLEGDPDQPIITGRVYNAEQMPPWELPANATQTGVLTRSSKDGAYGNANALRFEDKKGAEQVWLHAEKNQDIEVENDETHWVGHDRSKAIDHDETTVVKHDRTETVGNNEAISIGVNRTEKVGSNENITIGVNRTEAVGANEAITIGANRSINVGGSETATVALQRTHAVGANETIAIGAAQEVAIGAYQTVNVGANRSVNTGASLSTSVGSSESRSVSKGRSTTVGDDDAVKVGKNFVLEAGDSITLKTGSASITMKKDGTISIEGKDINIKASGDLNQAASGKINVKASGDVVIKGSKVLNN
ncbi:MAG: type VI secretion system tip protein VgrG [Betaproteobacteria bacterium]|nr:type VI secretion system tip protein VgrG [Betaproteobacteria bacterium]